MTWLPGLRRAHGRVATIRMEAGTIEVLLPRERRCAEVSESEEAELLNSLKVLAAEKPLEGNPAGRETISWWLNGGAEGLVAANELSPQAAAAMQGIACLAFGKLSKVTRTAVGGATPELAARLGFPESCPAVPARGANNPADS